QVYCHLGIFGSKSIIVNEPPCAEPHAGWCGGWRLETSGYPIYMYIYLMDVTTFLPLITVNFILDELPTSS
ncbi:MAG: hypothetical protein ACI9YH_005171, partial [Colwellia sp.]